jgi:hypothetical protein
MIHFCRAISESPSDDIYFLIKNLNNKTLFLNNAVNRDEGKGAKKPRLSLFSLFFSYAVGKSIFKA